jgi:ribosomal protein S18 acetylase RimI-like enzyme
MKIEPGMAQQVPEAAGMLADAFASDQIAAYFFGGTPAERHPLVRELFEIIMSARVALSMPVFFTKLDGRIVGAIMGQDATRPDWLPEHVGLWSRFEAKQEGLVQRFNREDEAVNRFKPKRPHYYIGVVGTHLAYQGKGIGSALIKHFYAASDTDKASSGTYLETANILNVNYYQRLGFEPAGEAELDGVTKLWTLFRPTPSRAESSKDADGKCK